MLFRLPRPLRAISFWAALLLAFPVVSASAQGTPPQIDRNDFEAILEIARGYGEADLTSIENGDPVIVGDINGTAYQLFFLECEDNRDCGVLDFYAIWDQRNVALELVNIWNGSQPFNKSYLTPEGLPVVELNVSAIDLTRTRLTDAFDRWTITLAAFPREVLDVASQ